MIADVLNARIREYAPASATDQENVLQELMQHCISSMHTAIRVAKTSPLGLGRWAARFRYCVASMI